MYRSCGLLARFAVSTAESAPGWVGRRALGETALVNVALLGCGAVTGILTARLLGPEGRGVVALALAVSGLAGVIAGFGLIQAFAYTVAADRSTLREALSLSLAVGLLPGAVVVAVGYPLSALLVHNQSAVSAVRIALIAVPIGVIGGNLTGVLQGLRRARPFNFLRMAVPLAYFILLSIAALSARRLSAVNVVFLYLVACSFATFAGVFILRGSFDLRRKPSRSFTLSTLRYGIVVNAGSLAWAANKQFALFVLPAVTTLAATGIYSVAISYALPVGIAATAIAIHTLPDIAAQTDLYARASLARRRLRTTLFTTAPLAIAAMVAAPALIPIAFGHAFSSAVIPAEVLVVGQAFLGANHVLSEISRGVGKPGLPAVIEGFGAVGTVIVLPLVVPDFGLVGAAVSSTLFT